MLYSELRGTKKLIFEKAVELFAEKSYELVSIKELATVVGRRQSALYNHFPSKQAILDTIYDFFCESFIADRPAVDDIEPILRNGSVLDIINAVYYDFAGEYKDILLLIYGIIQQRKYCDERARNIAKTLLIDSGIKYVEDIFNRAIEIGRLAPFDTHAMAVFCNYNRIGFYMEWVVDPAEENVERLRREIANLNKCAASHIIDLNPPSEQHK